MADLKGVVYELIASNDTELTNAEIGRRLGIYRGHVGHEGRRVGAERGARDHAAKASVRAAV